MPRGRPGRSRPAVWSLPVTAELRRNKMSGLQAGALIAGLAAVAHAAAGGSLSASTAIVPMLVVAALGAAMTARVRWTFARILTVALVGQLVLHVVLDGASRHGEHAHHGEHAGLMAGSAPTTGSSMWVAHLLLAGGSAIVLRWGWLWLRSMPAMLRAVVLAAQAIGAPVALAARRLVSSDAFASGRADASAWLSRGPPAVA